MDMSFNVISDSRRFIGRGQKIQGHNKNFGHCSQRMESFKKEISSSIWYIFAYTFHCLPFMNSSQWFIDVSLIAFKSVSQCFHVIPSFRWLKQLSLTLYSLCPFLAIDFLLKTTKCLTCNFTFQQIQNHYHPKAETLKKLCKKCTVKSSEHGLMLAAQGLKEGRKNPARLDRATLTKGPLVPRNPQALVLLETNVASSCSRGLTSTNVQLHILIPV